MIKTFYTSEINEDFLTALSEVISNNEEVKIYLCSGGGSEWISEASTHIINENKDNIELIGYGALESAAFKIFMDAKCQKSILPNTTGMFHQGKWTQEVDDFNKPYYASDKFQVKKLENIRPYYLDKLKKWGFTKKEISDYKKNKDVYFTHERFLEMLRK